MQSLQIFIVWLAVLSAHPSAVAYPGGTFVTLQDASCACDSLNKEKKIGAASVLLFPWCYTRLSALMEEIKSDSMAYLSPVGASIPRNPPLHRRHHLTSHPMINPREILWYQHLPRSQCPGPYAIQDRVE